MLSFLSTLTDDSEDRLNSVGYCAVSLVEADDRGGVKYGQGGPRGVSTIASNVSPFGPVGALVPMNTDLEE